MVDACQNGERFNKFLVGGLGTVGSWELNDWWITGGLMVD